MAPPYPSQLLDNRNTLKNNTEQTRGHINIHPYILAEQLRWLRKLNDDVDSVHLFTPPPCFLCKCCHAQVDLHVSTAEDRNES